MLPLVVFESQPDVLGHFKAKEVLQCHLCVTGVNRCSLWCGTLCLFLLALIIQKWCMFSSLKWKPSFNGHYQNYSYYPSQDYVSGITTASWVNNAYSWRGPWTMPHLQDYSITSFIVSIHYLSIGNFVVGTAVA